MDALERISGVRCYLAPSLDKDRVVLLVGPKQDDGKPRLDAIMVHDQECADRMCRNNSLEGFEVVQIPSDVFEGALLGRRQGLKLPDPPAGEPRRPSPGRSA